MTDLDHKTNHPKCTDKKMRRFINRHFKGAITSKQEKMMRAHLASCDWCHGYYERHLLLAQIDPKGVSAERRLSQGLGIRQRIPRYKNAFPLLLATSTVAVAMIAIIPWLNNIAVDPPTQQFAARGKAIRPASEVFIFRLKANGKAENVKNQIKASDELAIAYRNGKKKKWLAVFAVDGRHRIYWYHPSWQDARTNPKTIPLRQDGRIHELPEAIQHPITSGSLRIIAWFSDQRLTVREIEDIMNDKRHRQRPKGTIEQVVTLHVDQ